MLFQVHLTFSKCSPGGMLVRVLVYMALLGLDVALPAHAQWASVRGRVVDAADEQPLPGAAIMLSTLDEGAQTGTAADGNGYFILGRLTPGPYVLETSFVGYHTTSDTLMLTFGDRRSLVMHLEADEAELDEVVVESERQPAGAASGAGLLSVSPSALARIPMPTPSPDLAGYLQSLPGVVATGDRGGQFFVRGGTPTQNLVLLDGIPVFQPFHIVGFYSAFPADLIAYANIHTGGFGARYGGRLSSVIDVATRNGNKRRVAASAALAPFLGSVRVEVPFVPEKVSIIGSVRESVIERVAPDVLGENLPYRFGDRFAKVHAFLNRTSSLSLVGLNTYDRGDVADTEGRPSTISWSNKAYGGQYVYLPEDYPVMTRLSIFHTAMDSQYQPFGARHRRSEARTFGANIDFTYYLSTTVLRFGLFGLTHRVAFTLDQAEQHPYREQEEFLTEGGIYLASSIDLNEHLLLEPGVRMHSFPSRSETAWEPRLRAEWRPGGPTSHHVFNAAWGLYHQELVGLYNTRDVTDAFIAWMPSPEQRAVPQAMHVVGGWQGQIYPGVSLGAEAYFKDFAHMAFARYDDELDTGFVVDETRGEAYGIDFKLEAARAWVYTTVSYSLARVRYERQRRFVIEEFAPPHDRRHQINALIQFTRGPYALKLRWQFGSGLPFTRVQGFYDTIAIDQPDDSFRTDPGEAVLVAAPKVYDARLPAYHRLDASIERRFEARRFAATIHASVINLYNRANLFDFDLFANRRINQLPFIPSVGLNMEIK